MGGAERTGTPSGAQDVVQSMCARHASAVSASDSAAYPELFTADAIRMPPRADPEHGPEQIRRGDPADYDVAGFSIRSTLLEAPRIAEHWVYGLAQVDHATTAHADGTENHLASFGAPSHAGERCRASERRRS